MSLGLIVLLALAVLAVPQGSAQATGQSYRLALYLDAPFVQGSYVAENAQPGDGTSFSSFNKTGGTGFTCNDPDQRPAGTEITGLCRIDAAASHGGATADADVSAPTVGGDGSNFPTTTGSGSANAITITMTDGLKARYIGLWWASGSPGNTITFWSGEDALLTVNSNDILNIVKPTVTLASEQNWKDRVNGNPSAVPPVLKDTETVSNLAGGTYRKVEYYGNPRGYEGDPPQAVSEGTWSQPFVYLHLFGEGAVSFDKIVLSGAGFEFDNLVIATASQTPDPRLVLVDSYSVTAPALGFPNTVTFDGNGDNVVGTIADQTATQPTSLTSNSFRRSGFRFTGWNTAADGSGTSYADGATYNFFADVTLYAQWAAVAASTNKKPALADDEVAVVPQLAATGGELPPYPLVIAGIIAAGVVLTVVSRRRRSEVGY